MTYQIVGRNVADSSGKVFDPRLSFGNGESSVKALGPKDKIIFLGDSITEQGGGPRGYVTIATDSLKAKYGEHVPTVINTGISGNKVTDLQARLDRDVLSMRPTLVVIYIGINDVWHFAMPGSGGTPKDVYEAGLRDVVLRVRATGAAVILCTPSVIGEKHNGGNPQDAMLDEYSGISREIAKETGVSLCDLRKIFIASLRLNNPDNVSVNILTVDGVHLNDEGNKLVARSIMESIGL